jgi:putative nucleotidyltransferase with HDIG domain
MEFTIKFSDKTREMERLPAFIRDAVRSATFVPTKHHRELPEQHLLECARHCERLADQFDVPKDLAYDLGLYHDIGKPFVEKQIKKNFSYVGHAQMGSYLISRMEHPYKEVLMFVVNHHMCCCSHQRGLGTLTCFKSLLSITLPDKDPELCIRALALLFVADMLARISDDTFEEQTLISYSKEFIHRMLPLESNQEAIRKICIQKQSSNDKVVILPLGTSGCGKSTFSKNIPQAVIIERDQCYFDVAAEESITGTYKEVYKAVSELPDGKTRVQKLFVKRIANTLEDPSVKIIIIDTMQTLFPHAWKFALESLPEDARAAYASSLKIGVYLFPQNQLGAQFEPKTGHYSRYPDSFIQFPRVNLETGVWNPMEIDFGTGDTESVSRICKRYLNEIIVPECPPQGPSLKMGLTPNLTVAQFPPGIVNITQEYENQDWLVETLNYMDGFQLFTGPTRDYRGETFAYNKTSKTYHLLRGSLPVFPDFCSIEKDPGCYPYLKDVWTFRPEWEKHIPFDQDFQLKVTPKFDGSLFNLTFIPGDQFPGIDPTRTCRHGNVFYGSKGRFLAREPVMTRIRNAIEGSYGSNEVFLRKVETFLEKKNLTGSRVTLHFEAIDAIPTPELTVYYGRAWCPLFGYTVFTDTCKSFFLPNPDDMDCVTPVINFRSWAEVLEYSSKNHERLLEGDESIEPEGYVVHIFGKDGIWLPVKLKYEFYYIAHKPDSKHNREKAKAISEDPKYEKLRNRLAKFRNAIPVETLIGEDVRQFLLKIPAETLTWDRKHWALFWIERKQELGEFGEKLETLVTAHMSYMKGKLATRVFDVLMKMFKGPMTDTEFIRLLMNQ